MDTLAAVDLGSNSFHLIVARVHHDQLQIIDRLKEMVRLGAGLDDQKKLIPEVEKRALDCLARFGQRLAHLPPQSVRVVGTNTLRQVDDGGTFLTKAEQALGQRIEIISGQEEARLVYLGVAHGFAAADDQYRLVVDIGGGSTELIIGQGMESQKRESLFMGCVSFSQRFFAEGKISKRAMQTAIIAGQLELRPYKREFNAQNWQQALGSSGTIRSIRDVLHAQGWSDQGINRSGLKKLRQYLIEVGHSERLELEGLSENRRPVFAGGVAVLTAVFRSLDIEEMRVSEFALREGLLFELLGSIQHHDSRQKTVANLIKRYHLDQEQGQRVQRTALSLFDQVQQDWQLDEEDKNLLSWAAQLYEIGLSISHDAYHKHGAYILAHSDLAGFSRQAQQSLAALVQVHRRKFKLEAFDHLHRDNRLKAVQLSILLRLAVLLHRGRSPEDKPANIMVKKKNIVLSFPPDWLRQHPLTHAELQQEADYLQKIDYRLSF